jgi:multidrug resistance protein, MATE family
MLTGENNTYNEDDGQVLFERPSEYSPLLGKPSGGYQDNGMDEENKYMGDYHTIEPCAVQTTWVKEMKILLASSVPLVITFLLQNSINLASIFAVGRMGKVELGAVSRKLPPVLSHPHYHKPSSTATFVDKFLFCTECLLSTDFIRNKTVAITTLHITFIAPAQGLASSLDTSCAQAYGNRRYHLVGLQCQRVTLLCLCMSIPIALLWLFSEPILRLVVTNPRSAHLTAEYLRIMILSMPGVIVFETGKRLLQAQGLFRATTYILLLAAPVNVFINWLLISEFNMGFIGAPLAVMITRNLLPVFLMLYIRFVNGSKCWGGLSIRALANWKPMMKLALPSMIMVEAEFLAFEIITLLCSTLGTGQLASWGIVASLSTVSWQVPFAMSIAASSRIANLIGAGSPEAAKITARMVSDC